MQLNIGCSQNADPPQMEVRRLQAFVNRAVSQNYVSKNVLRRQIRRQRKRMEKMEQEIAELKALLQKPNANYAGNSQLYE